MPSFAAIIAALSGAAIGGVITYYIVWVLTNNLYLSANYPMNQDSIWALILILMPLLVAAIIGGVIVKLFD